MIVPAELSRKGLKQVQQSVRHAGVTAWLLRDFFRFLGWSSLTITLVGVASVGVKFGAAGVLHLFVRALSEQNTVQLPGFPDISVNIRDFFVAGVIVGLILMGVSTLLQFQVRLIAIRAARSYEEHCTRRLIALASRLPHRDAVWASGVYRSGPLQVFFAYIRAAAMVARQTTRLLPSLISFCLACLLLAWLNPTTTAALALVAVAVMLVQYPLNNRSARASTKNDQHRREASQRLAELFGQLRQGPVPLAQDSAVLNALFEKRGPLRKDIESFSRRADGGVLASMVSRLGTHLLLGMVLLSLGLDIIAGRQGWADVAVYVVVVQFALRDFLSVGKLLSSVSRYYGQVECYMNFVRSASQAPAAAQAEHRAPTALWLAVPSMDGTASTLPLVEGGLIAVFPPPQASTPFAMMFLDALHASSGRHVMPPAWIDAGLLDDRVSLAENLALPATTDRASVERAVIPFGPKDAAPMKPGWLNRTPASFRHGLPDWLVCALKVIAARERGHPCFALQAKLFGDLPETWRSACREFLGDGVLFVLHANPALIGRFGERAALIGDMDGLLCWAPIENDRLDAITAICRDVAQQRQKRLPATRDHELLED